MLGRDVLIADCWRTLQVQSLALLAPRRIGKTSILTRMAAEPPEGFVVVRRDLEGLASTAEFVHVLLEDVEQVLGRWRCTAKRALAYLDKLAVETRHVKVQLEGTSWKRLLDRLFEDLEAELAQRDCLLVLLWDEVTLFIGDLVRRGQAEDAMALLDALRAARQRHPHVRMVLTGSIGFDEVLRQLRRAHDYRNRPINDVARCFVPLLDTTSSTQLISALLGPTRQDPELVEALLSSCEGHPFVIQLLTDRLVRMAQPRAQDVEPLLRELLTPPGDALDLTHYLERIDTHFDAEHGRIARALLDSLARHEGGSTRAELLAALPSDDSERVLATIRLLEDDFYLRREGGELRFMLELLRTFWREERGL